MQQSLLKTLNKKVFFPPVIFLIITIAYSLINNDHFLVLVKQANDWILETFGWLFTWSTFLFLLTLAIVYFSPMGRKTIGGATALPILTKWKWFAITLCTTVATGLLFWGNAEPLYHLHSPPESLGISPNSPEAIRFSMSTMFMHWTLTPYGIYTITGLLFAITYYNLKQPFSISSLLYPLFGERAHGTLGVIINIICLYGLVAGMAASLGAGIFTLMGGLEAILGIPKSNFLLGVIGFAVVGTFIISAVSGLAKGIALLSDLNIKAFIALAIFVFIFGPTLDMLQMAVMGIADYFYYFIPRSTNIGANIDASWQNSWTFFYWAAWFAWAPVSALFLGQLAVGYTVRDYIHFNFLLPCLFISIWLMIFSGISIEFDLQKSGELYNLMKAQGEQNVLYAVLAELPLAQMVSLFTLIIVFISYVTAADSNTSAMSSISSIGINPDNPEAPLTVKIIWGCFIGLIAWIMITTAGVDGIRLLNVLGGFPALFLIIGVMLGLLKLMLNGTMNDEVP